MQAFRSCPLMASIKIRSHPLLSHGDEIDEKRGPIRYVIPLAHVSNPELSVKELYLGERANVKSEYGIVRPIINKVVHRVCWSRTQVPVQWQPL